MRKYFAVIYFAVFLVGMATAQNNKCGLPSYRPKQGESHTYKDTCGTGYYIFNNNKWYRQFQINQTAAPQFSFLNGSIEIDNTEAIYFNTTFQRYYKAIFEGGIWKWVTITLIEYENIVFTIGDQDIAGVKTFQDTSKFEKGIISKGVNTEGSSSQTAMTLKGVVSDRDTTISTNNYVLNGLYGTVKVNTSTGNKIIITPNASTTADWIFNIRKETSDANTVTIKDSNGNDVYILYSKMIVKIKNSNNSWKKESVSF
jgi:hypothetical protein